jgi:ADP-ribosyl-[dinitrogen reductase] hydrolase
MDLLARYRGCLLGLAAGDAVGTTVEFTPRDSFAPLTDMVGGGPFRLPPGAWTDDTSMALCLATSLVECDGFDARDQMERYCRWYANGYLSSTGRCFDIGITTARALRRFQETGNPFAGSIEGSSAGNGSLMRLAPVPLFFYPDRTEAVLWAGESSRTTHGATECVEACQLFAALLCGALAGESKDALLRCADPASFTSPKVRAIAAGDYRAKHRDQIASSGYVIHCLEAALWCFWHADSFAEAILLAANLGDDADTTAAVCGQIAGAFHGDEGIPSAWRERLVMGTEITHLAERLARQARPGGVAATY